jgi:hypothetical protein
MRVSNNRRLARKAPISVASPKKELTEAATEALQCDLADEHITELVAIHEGYLENRDSSGPYVADVQRLSEADRSDYFTKLRNRAQKLLDSLRDKPKELQKAPAYRKFLSELLFANAIKEIEFVLSTSNWYIQMSELTKNPEKLIDVLESGRVRFVPPVKRLPKDILNQIRQRKIRKGGPKPDLLLHNYIENMLAWYKVVVGRRPGSKNTRFADLVNRCLNVVDKDQTVSGKMIRGVLKKWP